MSVSQEILNRHLWTVGTRLEDELIVNYGYNGSGVVEYKGFAVPGSGDDAPVWRILRYLFDGSGNVTGARFAEGSADFDKVWDDRAGYTYS